MKMRKIQNANVENKRVLLRVDFNVAIENGALKENFKIKAAKATLNYLLARNAQVALISHLGRPDGKIRTEFSFAPLADKIGKILDCQIKFIPNCIGEKVSKSISKLKKGEVLLLENVRFYKEEKENNEKFAKELTKNFNLFINDAFSVSHRNQSSVTGVTNFLPSYAGLRLQKEVREMEKIKNNYTRPAVAIIGGAKIETKLPAINFFEQLYDYVLVGGKIANEALDKNLKFSPKVILPVDFASGRFDIGSETIKKFEKIIRRAETVVWNGPTGKIEEEKYAVSSNVILKAIIKSNAYSVVGGGETLEILRCNDALDKISFVSTGGGAMLEYLGGGNMPGIEALKE